MALEKDHEGYTTTICLLLPVVDIGSLEQTDVPSSWTVRKGLSASTVQYSEITIHVLSK